MRRLLLSSLLYVRIAQSVVAFGYFLRILCLLLRHVGLRDNFSLILGLHPFVETHPSLAHCLLLGLMVILLLYFIFLTCWQVVHHAAVSLLANASVKAGWESAGTASRTTTSASAIAWLTQLSLMLYLVWLHRCTWAQTCRHLDALLWLPVFDLYDIRH